jgi:molybdate transport system substrate-binding protein
MRGRRGIAAAAVGLALMAPAARAEELTVIASTAMREALEALAPEFARASGHTVHLRFESGATLPVRIKEGAPSDLVVTTPATIDDLVAAGRLEPGSRVDFVRSRVGVAVRAGAPKPDIATEAAFVRALRAAPSVGISRGPSGVYTMGLLERLGIADEIKAKAVVPELGQRVGTLIARGDAALGIQQVTELVQMPGIDFVGPLPAALQTAIVYATARPVDARARAAAGALVAFLTSPAARPAITKLGLEPA